MHLIIGGAYQGKLDFAKAQYGFTEAQIFHCGQDRLELSAPCIADIQEYVYGCTLRGEDVLALFQQHRQALEDKVLILRDVSGGLVPVSKTDRAFREANGKLCQYLSREAVKVSRIFCGLEQRLK